MIEKCDPGHDSLEEVLEGVLKKTAKNHRKWKGNVTLGHAETQLAAHCSVLSHNSIKQQLIP